MKKIIVVVGATSDVGFNLCQKLLLKFPEASFFFTGRKIENLTPFKNQKTITLSQLDITKADEVQSYFKAFEGKNIAQLILCTGVESYSTFLTTEEKELREVMEVNFWGVLNIIKAATPYLGKERTQISIMNSELATYSIPFMGLYGASKSALHSMVKTLRLEFANKNISLNQFFPAYLDTKFHKHSKMPQKSSSISLDDFSELIISKFDKTNQDVFPLMRGKLIQILTTFLSRAIQALVFLKFKKNQFKEW